MGAGAEAATVIGLLAVAAAQSGPSANMQHLWPTGGAQGFVAVPSARQLARGEVGGDGLAGYAHRPLQRGRVVGDQVVVEHAAIEGLFAVQLRGAYGVTDAVELALDVPALQAIGIGPGLGAYSEAAPSVAAGDVTLAASLRPLDEEVLGVAVQPFVTLPTGSRGALLTHGVATLGARLALSRTLGPVHLAANLGYRLVPGGAFLEPTIGVDDTVLFGAALGFDLVPERARLNVELFGHAVVGEAKRLALPAEVSTGLYTPTELLVSVRAQIRPGLGIVAGAGPGVAAAAGTPAVRALLGLSGRVSTGRSRDRAPAAREPVPPPSPPVRTATPAPVMPAPPAALPQPRRLDRDSDGVEDALDRCPDQPETPNGYRDEDGCPDLSPVVVDAHRIELLEPIRFVVGGASVDESSLPVVGELARVLVATSSIARIRVEVHTAPGPDPRAALALSEQRARALQAMLLASGVHPLRIAAEGVGSYVPPERADQPHERVELYILERE